MAERAHSRALQLSPVHPEGRLYQEFPVGTTTILVSPERSGEALKSGNKQLNRVQGRARK